MEHVFRWRAVLVGMLAACLAAACGGDGGAEVVFADADTRAPDVQAPDTGGPADTPVPDEDTADQPEPNRPPAFWTPDPVTLAMGTSTSVDLNDRIADDEDFDHELVISWSAEHVAMEDPGDHVLFVVAPTDWFGVEEIELIVTDTGGLTASTTLVVTVTEVTVAPPGPEDPVCGETTFRYEAAPEVEEVLVAGSFNGWGTTASTATPMTDDDEDDVWEATVVLEPGRYLYKLIVDGVWLVDPANEETENDGQGNVNNVLRVAPCDGLPPCEDTLFRLDAGTDVQTVLVSGTFNGWGETPESADPLLDPDSDGMWELAIRLAPGTYQYKFLVDGAWQLDPENPNTVDDGTGNTNNVLVVDDCEETEEAR